MYRPRALCNVKPLTSIAAAIVLTPLLPFTRLDGFSSLLFAVINDDAANPVDLLIETSEDGAAVDAGQTWTLTVPPTGGGTPSQRTLEIADNIRGWYRVSATASGGSANLRWLLRGAPRL